MRTTSTCMHPLRSHRDGQTQNRAGLFRLSFATVLVAYIMVDTVSQCPRTLPPPPSATLCSFPQAPRKRTEGDIFA